VTVSTLSSGVACQVGAVAHVLSQSPALEVSPDRVCVRPHASVPSSPARERSYSSNRSAALAALERVLGDANLVFDRQLQARARLGGSLQPIWWGVCGLHAGCGLLCATGCAVRQAALQSHSPADALRPGGTGVRVPVEVLATHAELQAPPVTTLATHRSVTQG